jgi:hypothetical protein
MNKIKSILFLALLALPLNAMARGKAGAIDAAALEATLLAKLSAQNKTDQEKWQKDLIEQQETFRTLWQEKHDQLDNQHKAQQNKVESLETQLSDAKRSLQEAVNEKAPQTEINRIDSAIKLIIEQKNHATKNLKTLEQQFQQLDQQFNSMQKEVTDKINLSEKKLQDQISAQETALADHKTNLSKTEKKFVTANENIEKANAGIAKIQEQLENNASLSASEKKALLNQANELEAYKKENENKMQTLMLEQKQQNEKIALQEKNLQNQTNELKTLNQALAQSETKNARAIEQAKEQTLQEVTNKINTEKTQLQNKIETINQEMQSKINDLNKNKADIDLLKSVIEQIKISQNMTSTEKQRIADDLSKSLTQSNETVRRQKGQMDQLEQDKKLLTDKISEYDQALKDIEKRMQESLANQNKKILQQDAEIIKQSENLTNQDKKITDQETIIQNIQNNLLKTQQEKTENDQKLNEFKNSLENGKQLSQAEKITLNESIQVIQKDNKQKDLEIKTLREFLNQSKTALEQFQAQQNEQTQKLEQSQKDLQKSINQQKQQLTEELTQKLTQDMENQKKTLSQSLLVDRQKELEEMKNNLSKSMMDQLSQEKNDAFSQKQKAWEKQLEDAQQAMQNSFQTQMSKQQQEWQERHDALQSQLSNSLTYSKDSNKNSDTNDINAAKQAFAKADEVFLQDFAQLEQRLRTLKTKDPSSAGITSLTQNFDQFTQDLQTKLRQDKTQSKSVDMAGDDYQNFMQRLDKLNTDAAEAEKTAGISPKNLGQLKMDHYNSFEKLQEIIPFFPSEVKAMFTSEAEPATFSYLGNQNATESSHLNNLAGPTASQNMQFSYLNTQENTNDDARTTQALLAKQFSGDGGIATNQDDVIQSDFPFVTAQQSLVVGGADLQNSNAFLKQIAIEKSQLVEQSKLIDSKIQNFEQDFEQNISEKIKQEMIQSAPSFLTRALSEENSAIKQSIEKFVQSSIEVKQKSLEEKEAALNRQWQQKFEEQQIQYQKDMGLVLENNQQKDQQLQQSQTLIEKQSNELQNFKQNQDNVIKEQIQNLMKNDVLPAKEALKNQEKLSQSALTQATSALDQAQKLQEQTQQTFNQYKNQWEQLAKSAVQDAVSKLEKGNQAQQLTTQNALQKIAQKENILDQTLIQYQKMMNEFVKQNQQNQSKIDNKENENASKIQSISETMKSLQKSTLTGDMLQTALINPLQQHLKDLYSQNQQFLNTYENAISTQLPETLAQSTQPFEQSLNNLYNAAQQAAQSLVQS